MVTCTLEMVFDGPAEGEALRVLRTLIFPVRTEHGCLGTRLLHEIGGEEGIVWVSRWEDWGAFEDHVLTAHFRLLLGVLEMASETPGILVERSVERRGLEAIEAILVAHDRV